MTDITPERIAELRQEHVLYPHDPEGPRFCQQCEERWPCTTIALCDALQEARGTASACYGQEMCRGFRDIYEVVARRRDQLRAENERLRAALPVAQVVDEWCNDDSAAWELIQRLRTFLALYQAARADVPTGGVRTDNVTQPYPASPEERS